MDDVQPPKSHGSILRSAIKVVADVDRTDATRGTGKVEENHVADLEVVTDVIPVVVVVLVVVQTLVVVEDRRNALLLDADLVRELNVLLLDILFPEKDVVIQVSLAKVLRGHNP